MVSQHSIVGKALLRIITCELLGAAKVSELDDSCISYQHVGSFDIPVRVKIVGD